MASRSSILSAVRSCSVAAVLCAGLVGPAAAQVYKCQGPDGVVEYSNTPGNRQGCVPIQLNPITTIPAPRLPVPASKPAASAPPKAPAQGTSASFPRVDSATQRARDNDRRAILEEELRKENEKLAELRAEYKDGEPDRLGNERNFQKYLDRVERLKDDIARSEANVESIQREISAIRN